MTSFAFDNNTWYQIQSPSKPNQSIYADWVTGADGGTAVFFNATSNTNTGQQFQFYNPSNYSLNTFMLRANRPGSSMYFGASNPKHTPSQIGSTRPSMRNAFFLKEDFGCVWNVTAWGGDGTYYLSNYANGTNWHLAVDDDGLLFMDSNLSADDSHKFTFQNVGNGIYNPSYSYVQTPTSAPAPGQTNPSMLGMSPAPTSFPNDGSCSYSTTAAATPGLSPATSAGIAAAVTATVCGIIMAAVIFFLLRRRDEPRNQEQGWPGASGSRQWQKVGELDASSNHSAELDHAQMSKMELYGDSPTATPTATINTMNSISTFGHVRRTSSTERLAKVAFESPSRVRASYRSYR